MKRNFKYHEIKSAVKDYLKLLGQEENENTTNILSEMVILHCYEPSENFQFIYSSEFLKHVIEYIKFHDLRNNCEFKEKSKKNDS